MDIYLSINNRERVIKLPVVPEAFDIKSPQNNEIFTSVSQGDLKLIGLQGLKSLSLQSFFPVKDYPFLRDRTYKGWEYVTMLEAWKAKRVPIRLIITGTPINLPMAIESFTYGVHDGSGDINYTLELEEFRFIKLQQKKV